MSTTSTTFVDSFYDSFYVGINIENILYGIELLLYFKTIGILLSSRGTHKKPNLFYALFSSMMVFLITVWVAAQAVFGHNMWFDRDFPGGPDAYWKANIDDWYMDLGAVAVIILQLMTDALMIYRCRIIWNSNRVIVVPIILWLATLTLSALVAWVTSFPGSNFITGVAAQFSLAYWSVSVFLNTTLTCMICYRLVWHGRKVQEYLGHEHASFYFAVVNHCRICASIHTLWHCLFGVVWGGESDGFDVHLCVFSDDVHITADADPPSSGGEGMGQRWVQPTALDTQVQS